MSVGTFWLVYGLNFLFISGIVAQATTLDCQPENVFENESVSIVLSFVHSFEWSSFWDFNKRPFGIVSWKSGQCTKNIFQTITSVSVFCNSTTASIRIEKVQKSMHGIVWGAYLENTPVVIRETYIYVKVPVKYVNVTFQGEEFRRKLTYVENETATLECTSSLSRPQPANIWCIGQSYSDASIVASNSFNESDGTYNYARSVLALTVNRANNNKWIFCNSSNVPEFAPVSSNYSLLDVQYPPSIGQLDDISINEGKMLTKTCPIQEGNPAETHITWTSMKSTDIISTNVKLEIVNISRNHTAQYTCFARNMMTRSNGSLQEGMARNSFNLNVLFPPEKFKVTCLADGILNENIGDTLLVSQGTHLTLSCIANSNPSPSSYIWNGTITAIQSQLSFNVNKNHSGDITCTARNNMTEIPGNSTIGSNNNTIKMSVFFPPEISKLHNITVIEGKSVEFNGHVLPGNPQQTVFSWTRNLDGKTWNNETFSIISVNRSDESEYTLSVNNIMNPTCGTQGSGHSTKILYMKVLYPPEQFIVACLADNLRNDGIADVFNITEGTNLTLECNAKSNPPPSNYSWNGTIMSRDKYITFYVTIKHSGDYTCTASNTMNETSGNTTVASKSKTYRLNVLYPPQISEMENITVIEGKPVEFKGNVTPGRPQEMQLYWTRQTDQQVWKSETFSISSVNRSHESEYTFSVSNSMRPTCGKEVIGYRNKTVLMKVLYPPESLRVTCLTDSSRNEAIVDVFTINEGTNLTLACSANSNPSPSSYSWNGRIVTNQSSISFYVTKQHSGDYICTVNNTMKEIPGNTTIGTKSKMYRMSVLYAPEVNKMQNMTAVEGKWLSVYCNVTLGNPSETTIKWIRRSDNRTWYGQTMTIDNVTRHDDNTYTCIANNTLQPTYGNTIIGLTSQNVNVEILYKASITSFVIEGHTNVNNVTVNETDLVTFRCTVESNPASFMKLTFKDKPLLEKNITKDLVHVMYKAECTDWGTYFCYGYNSYNSLQNIPRIYIHMYVNCAPRQSSTVYPSSNVTNVTSGQHVSCSLTFKALAYPKPSVRWYKKQDSSWVELISDLSTKILITSSEDSLENNLRVLNISQSDYGQYRLDITNSFGLHQQIFNLIPNDKPSPPKQFGVYEQTITETSAILWWEPGFDGGLPQTFIIGVRGETVWKNNTSVKDTDALIMNATITGLMSGTQYHFCIFALNQLGSTRFPDEITVTTKAQPFETDSNVAVVGPAVGGAFGVLLLVGALVSITVFCRKRRSGKRPDTPIYQNMKTKVINGENMSSLDGGRSNIYEKLQNTGSGCDQQYQQLSSFAREGQHKIYENLRLTQANGQQGAKIENPSGSLNRASPNKHTQSIV